MQLFHFSNFITVLLTFISTSLLFQHKNLSFFPIHTHSHPRFTLDHPPISVALPQIYIFLHLYLFLSTSPSLFFSLLHKCLVAPHPFLSPAASAPISMQPRPSCQQVVHHSQLLWQPLLPAAARTDQPSDPAHLQQCSNITVSSAHLFRSSPHLAL